MDFSKAELGPKMAACTERERKFVWLLVYGDITDEPIKPTDAARLAGYSDPGGESSAIRVRAHELMHSERVLDAMREVASQAVRGLVAPSFHAVKALINNPKHRDHAKTVLTLLASTGVAEQKVSLEVTVNHTDAALESLALLKKFGASRDKLIEHFGYSGLARYEKMLEEREAKIKHDNPILTINGEVAK